MTMTATGIPNVKMRVRPAGRSGGGAYFWLLLFIIFYVYRPRIGFQACRLSRSRRSRALSLWWVSELAC